MGGAKTQCRGHCSTQHSTQQHQPGAASTRGSAPQDSLLLGCLCREKRMLTSKDKSHCHQEITLAGCRTAQAKGGSRCLRVLLRMHASHHAMGRHAVPRHPVHQPRGSARKVHDQRGCGAWHLQWVACVRYFAAAPATFGLVCAASVLQICWVAHCAGTSQQIQQPTLASLTHCSDSKAQPCIAHHEPQMA